MDYRYGSHTVFQIEYHFVWVTKYRYKVLTGDVAERVRAMVRQVCETFEIRIYFTRSKTAFFQKAGSVKLTKYQGQACALYECYLGNLR